MLNRVLSAAAVACALFAVEARAAYQVTTVAGLPGQFGYRDGPASEALFNRPTWIGVVEDDSGSSDLVHKGDVFVIDRVNNAVRKMANGRVTTFNVATGFPPNYGEPVPFDFGGGFGGGIAIEQVGSGCGSGVYDRGMFIASSGAQKLSLVAMNSFLANRDGIFPIGDGKAGAMDGATFQSEFRNPTGVALWTPYLDYEHIATRRLYVADTGNHTIRRVFFSLSFEGCPQPWSVATLAGMAGMAGWQDGVGAAARFNSPRGIAAAPDGTVYVADSGNHAIRRIAVDGTVTTIAGEAGVPGGDDGPALQAHLHTPSGIDVNADGEVFIADTGNNTIRKITKEGRLVTIAGAPGIAGFADGYGPAALFFGPVGLQLATDGSIYVADTSNHVVRRLVPVTIERRRPASH